MVDTPNGDSPHATIIPIIEEQGRALMQAVPDLVFLLGLDGTYIDIFSAADGDLFVPREELIGRTVLEVLPPPVGDDCMEAIGKLQSGRDVGSFSYKLIIDEKPRWFEGRVALCGNDTVIVLVRDFTDQRIAERDLREANTALHRRAEQLQRMERELTRVEQRERRRMAHLIHDNLQQLLVSAKLNVSILARRASDEGDQVTAGEVLSALDEAIQQSRTLTADLCPPIMYEGSLEQSLDWIRNHVARLHGLDVELFIDADVSDDLSESVRFTIFNAIRELLLNVVKHAEVDRAVINVFSPDPEMIAVKVGDDGLGFEPSILEEASEEMGGFGLFTLQERLAWSGGDLVVESRPGNGCTVTMRLPVQGEEESAPGVETESDPLPAEVGDKGGTPSYDVRGEGTIRVLIADDHAVLREGLIRILLQDSSFSVVGEAEDGRRAVRMAEELQPDVVLMDVMMPDMGGAEATRLIRQQNPDIQVIALSMYEEHERGEEMKQAGAAGYITKSQAAVRVADAIRICCG